MNSFCVYFRSMINFANQFNLNIRQMIKIQAPSSEQKICLLEKYIQTLQAENDAKNKERSTLYQQIQELTQENFKLEGKINESEETLNQKFGSVFLNGKLWQHAELAQENRILNEQIQELRKNTNLIIEELHQCRNILQNSSEFETENETLKQRSKGLQENVTQLTHILTIKQDCIESLKQQIMHQSKLIQEKKYNVQMLQKDQIEYRQEITSLQTQIKTQENQFKIFQFKLHQKQLIIKQSNALIKDLKERLYHSKLQIQRETDQVNRTVNRSQKVVDYNGQKFELKLSSLIRQNNKLVERLTALQRQKNMYYYHIRSTDMQNQIWNTNDPILTQHNLTNQTNVQRYQKQKPMKFYPIKSLKLPENETIRNRPEHDSKLKRKIDHVRQQNAQLVKVLKL